MIQQTTLQLVVQAVDNATAKLNGISDSVSGVSKRIESTTGAVFGLVRSFGALFIATGVASAFRALIDNSSEAQKSFLELDTAIKRTGGTAGVTTKQVQELAAQIQNTTAFSDEAVQDAASRLTLFTNVTGENFQRAIKVSSDLAARMGTDLPQAAASLGRALQDPGEGMRVLVQAGIKFNDEQIKTLQYMAETGHALEAQNIILDEVAKRTSGAAAEGVKTLGGAFSQLGNQLGELVEAPGIIDKVSKSTSELAVAIGKMRESAGGQLFAKVAGATADVGLSILTGSWLRTPFGDDAESPARTSRTNRTGAGASRGFDPLAAATEARVAAEKAAKEAEEAQKKQARRAEDAREGHLESIRRSMAEEARLFSEAQEQRVAFDRISAEELERSSAELTNIMEDNIRKLVITVEDPIKDFTDALKNGMKSAVASSNFTFKNFINNIISALLEKRLYDAIDKFGDALGKAASGSKSGGLFSKAVGFLGGIFAGTPAKAGGGTASGVFIAGDDGPEVIDSGINSVHVTNRRQMSSGGGKSASPVVNYSPVYNISGVETQAVIAYVENSRKQDQRGMLEMLYTNGFGRMR